MGLFNRPDSEQETVAAKTTHYGVIRPLTASAARVDLSKKNEIDSIKRRLSSTKWQAEAWDYYDLIGEVQFSANLIANVASRVRLFPGWVTSADTAPSNIFDVKNDEGEDPVMTEELKQAALETLRKLETGSGGIPGILRDAALNLFISGECFLVREPAPQGAAFGVEAWQIRSIDEIFIEGAGAKAKVKLRGRRDAKGEEDFTELPSSTYFNRIWRNHPRYSDEADSSMRPQLENCDQLLLYERAKRSIVKSRLNAGLLYVPDGLSNVSQSDGEDPEIDGLDELAPLSDDESDSFEENLIDAMSTPIKDEQSASAVVPLLVRGPAELGQHIRHISFERKFDPQISTDAERLLERILAGLDLPKDVVSGVGSAKYANAVVIEESLYKAHIEPMVLTIVDALTVLLMRPMLKALGFSEEQISRVTVWYDPSAITTKPDKATAATTGYELGNISKEAWRRSNGFSESDAPDGIETLQRLASEKGLLSEAIVEAALRTLAPELFDRVRSDSIEQSDPATVDAVDDALDGNADDSFAEPTPEQSPEPPAGLIEP